MIKLAQKQDVGQIVTVIESARAFLKSQDVDQWQKGSYPAQDDILRDIEAGVGHTFWYQDEIVGYAAAITGVESAYQKIKGKWLTDNQDYVTIHRLALMTKVRGQALGQQFLLELMKHFNSYRDFRIDTHPDNKVMQHILKKLFLVKCGYVTYESERVAYQKLLNEE